MKVMQIEGEWSAGHIRRAERPQPKPGPGEVLLKMEAASLNFRDTVLVRRGEDIAELKAEIATARAQLSSASSNARIESEAASRLGLVPADPNTTTYLRLEPKGR